DEIDDLYTFGVNGRAVALQIDTDEPRLPCGAILRSDPDAVDGIYQVPLGLGGASVPVLCDMTGGGWTLVFKKSSGVTTWAHQLWADAPVNDDRADLLNLFSSADDYSSRLLRTARQVSEYRLAV